jgi:3-oxoacyl-[acyl-carrier-protein] synthase II
VKSRRVVITGMGLLSPIGNSVDEVSQALRSGRSGISAMAEWPALLPDLQTRVGGTVKGLDEKKVPREFRRSMGRLALLASAAVDQAVAMARLAPEALKTGRAGLSIGQTVGSPASMQVFFDTLQREGVRGLKSTMFLQVMGHSAAANLAIMHRITGRVWAPAAACASASQAIGLGYETVRDGHQDVMICGGAEELHPSTAATFDILGGTSRAFNDAPSRTPRPFDKKRDGLVVAEGAGVVVLEAIETAVARGAPVYGEILGFATRCDGEHMSSPAKAGMAQTMAECLASAGLTARELDYVNAHATATPVGDVIEAEATREVIGETVPVSSTKGHTGHTLAACGAIETIFCLAMMRDGFLAPTLNLEEVDPACGGLRHLREVESKRPRRILNNNFAFGGVNTSLLLAAPE